LFVPLAVAATSVAGCERAGKDAAPVEAPGIFVNPKLVTVRTDAIGLDPACQPHLRRVGEKLVPEVPLDCIGKGPDPSRVPFATFALVHADNGGDTDTIVTLGGVLVDGDGHEVGRLEPDTLRIPAHGRRTFALVDDGRQSRPTATDARIDVRTAAPAQHPETVRITDGEVSKVSGQVVASGTVENLTDRPAIAVVIAGFQDAAGKPLTRPFALYQLEPHGKKAALFTGPPGTATGYIFVGQVEF
jgi:hypothetical protein